LSNIAVSVSDLAKIYRIGAKEVGSDSLAGSMGRLLRSPIENYRKYRSLYRFDDVLRSAESGQYSESPDVLWALKGVGFEVEAGETLGIIGRNGAGKSTLLKILSRITPPTMGSARIKGRISSLLEVGTGFHKELTGRENVYLNGTMLGMTKREVDARFDEIVEFSGVERFLDTPVKRYSSGMSVRLAFSVAAHLEPEILIVDEVLAVGDMAFQQRCLNKMENVGKEGRTVLFVSHNMSAMMRLCQRGIVLLDGSMVFDGPMEQAIEMYAEGGQSLAPARSWEGSERPPGADVARLRGVRVLDADGLVSSMMSVSEEFFLEMEYEVTEGGHEVLPHFYLRDLEGNLLFGTLEQTEEWYGKERPPGYYTSRVRVPKNFMRDGTFLVDCSLVTLRPDTPQFDEVGVVGFQLSDAMGPDTARGNWPAKMGGVVRPLLAWKTTYRSEQESMHAAR
jgi:lipopolysaccharide transport system ATP-binding protein